MQQLPVVKFGATSQKFELYVAGVLVSTSKHRDYWEYHHRRGDLPKFLEQYDLSKLAYEDAVVEEPPPVIRPIRESWNSMVDLLRPMTMADVTTVDEALPKKRGRPTKAVKKALPQGMTANILSDEEQDKVELLTPGERREIRFEFRKRTVLDQECPRHVAQQLAQDHKVVYKQVYDCIKDLL